MRRAVSILSVMLFLFSCKSNSDLSPVAYAAYMEDEDNEMKRTVKYGNISYTIQLATPEYVASKELDDAPHSDKDFSNRLHELQGYTFFYITISTEGRNKMNDPAFAEQRDMYYTQAAATDISLLNGNEELKPVTYHFENNYGLSPYNKLLVAFKTDDNKDGEWQLLFNDRFNENYLVKSSFSIKAIAQLPKLAIN